jgi:hypothetical protein
MNNNNIIEKIKNKYASNLNFNIIKNKHRYNTISQDDYHPNRNKVEINKEKGSNLNFDIIKEKEELERIDSKNNLNTIDFPYIENYQIKFEEYVNIELDNKETLKKINALRSKFVDNLISPNQKPSPPTSPYSSSNEKYKNENKKENLNVRKSLENVTEIDIILNKYSKNNTKNEINNNNINNSPIENIKFLNSNHKLNLIEEDSKKININQPLNFSKKKEENSIYFKKEECSIENEESNNIINKYRKINNRDNNNNQKTNKEKIRNYNYIKIEDEDNYNINNNDNYNDYNNNNNFLNINKEKVNEKDTFIKKINFIEDKINKIENFIIFEDNYNNIRQENIKIKLNEEIQINNQNLLNNNNNNNNFNHNQYQLQFNKSKDQDKDKEKYKLISNNNKKPNKKYEENFNLENFNYKQDIKFAKKSVFSQSGEYTTDEENQNENILKFADNLKNLKSSREKNLMHLEERESLSSSRSNKVEKIINKLPLSLYNNSLTLSFSKSKDKM